MKLVNKVLLGLVTTLPMIAIAAVDPVFDTAMTSLMANIAEYIGKGITYVLGIFGLIFGIKFVLGFIRKVAK